MSARRTKKARNVEDGVPSATDSAPPGSAPPPLSGRRPPNGRPRGAPYEEGAPPVAAAPTVVVAVPITPEAFAPFGDVVCAGLTEGRSANMGTATRCDWSAALESTRPGARPNLAVFRSLAKTLPFEMTLLEKHPCSTQAFLPMVCTRYLVCVAPALADGSPDVERLRAFRCGPGVGINYRRDVWHHPILALDGPADFAMLAWEDGSPQDCVEWPLAERLLITE